MPETERIARLICMASGGKPDMMVCGELSLVPDAPRRLHYAPKPADLLPLWHYYVPLARIVIAEKSRG